MKTEEVMMAGKAAKAKNAASKGKSGKNVAAKGKSGKNKR
jgi:hypothetical protein